MTCPWEQKVVSWARVGHAYYPINAGDQAPEPLICAIELALG